MMKTLFSAIALSLAVCGLSAEPLRGAAGLDAAETGVFSDSDLSMIMFMNAGKVKDESRRQACLKSAIAAAIRSNDVRAAAMAMAWIDGLGIVDDAALIEDALTEFDESDAKVFRSRLREAKEMLRAMQESEHSLDTVSRVIVKMQSISIPVSELRQPTTLLEAIRCLHAASAEHDVDKKGVSFVMTLEESEMNLVLPEQQYASYGRMRLCDALRRIVSSVGYDFFVERNGLVRVFKEKSAAPADLEKSMASL